MAYEMKFQLGSFDRLDRNALQVGINSLTRALVDINVVWLLAHPETPLIHESGVRWVPEPHQQEQFADIPMVLGRGFGDCDDLAAWRAAELRVRFGHPEATTFTRRQSSPPRRGQREGDTLYHVLVVSDLGVEDISAHLGMNWEV